MENCNLYNFLRVRNENMLLYLISFFLLITGVLPDNSKPTEESDLTYYLYTSDNPNKPDLIQSTSVHDLDKTSFSTTKVTIFIVHGWLGTHESASSMDIVRKLLDHHDVNIFAVDWSPISYRDYFSSKCCVKKVGRYMAKFAWSLVENYDLNLTEVTFIGYSLGAHICGNAGSYLDGKVDLIIGLDPAGPLFSLEDTDERLDETDAMFVHVIHTDLVGVVVLGFKHNSGHADYFPNGHSIQPGCVTAPCSHIRSYKYYAESISRNNRFVSIQCSSYYDYINGYCKDNPKSVMGGFPVDKTACGTYYLETNSEPLYAQG